MLRAVAFAVVILVLLPATSLYGESSMSFEADPKVLQVAEAYALDMVDIANNNFGVALDWSDNSIKQIEQIAALLHENYVKNKPPENTLNIFVKAIGSYVGEVYRRNHGAEWGWVTMNDQRIVGLKAKTGTTFWPWGKARKRITGGPEDNIWHYYQVLSEPKGDD